MSALMEEKYEQKEIESPSKRQEIIEKLKSKELLRYGSLITEIQIEEIYGISKNDLSYEKWQFKKLQLRECIKSAGYFVTSRGRNEDVYILQPHEMPKYNEQKNKSALNNLKQRQRGLHMIDSSLLSDEQQKKLEFEILRNGSIEIEMANKMKERCRF